MNDNDGTDRWLLGVFLFLLVFYGLFLALRHVGLFVSLGQHVEHER